MNSTTVTCPKCKSSFSIDEVLGHQLEEKIKAKLESENKSSLEQEKLKLQKQSEEEKEHLRKQMLEWQEKEKERIKNNEVRIKEQATKEFQEELKLLKQEAEAKDKKLQEAREMELKIRQEKNELAEKAREMELEVARKIDEERKKIEEKIKEMMLEEHRMKEAEKDKVINDLKKALEEAQLKATQSSQQLQGEIQELELENLLVSSFPQDIVEPVPKGMNGADLLQKVYDPTGRECGTIIWESKRTKTWSNEWVQKLKDDLRASKADVAIIVSAALPDGIKGFGPYEGIYVTDFHNVMGVTRLLRIKMIELCLAKLSTVGQNEKMQIIYNYLRGNEFKSRVEAIVESFNAMKQDLEKEKQWYTKMWAKREKQIQRVIDNTIGMHGDLHGLMGASLPELTSIEMTTVETLELVDSTEVYQTETSVTANFTQGPLDDVVSS